MCGSLNEVNGCINKDDLDSHIEKEHVQQNVVCVLNVEMGPLIRTVRVVTRRKNRYNNMFSVY